MSRSSSSNRHIRLDLSRARCAPRSVDLVLLALCASLSWLAVGCGGGGDDDGATEDAGSRDAGSVGPGTDAGMVVRADAGGTVTVDAGGPAVDAAVLAANGAACGSADACASGFCVDGVCCQSACDGTCVACTAERTGRANGVCAPSTEGTDPHDDCAATDGCHPGSCNGSGACSVAADGTTCRAAAGACDAPETCAGGVCPADALRPGETVCRAAIDVCDVTEYCTGSSPECPADALHTGGYACRVAAGDCDVAEVCDGTHTDCPMDQFRTSAPSCGNYLCSGTSVACRTSCTSHSDCSGSAVCVGNTCVTGRRMFVTSATMNGAFGGLAAADGLCQSLATSAGLTGNFRAWLSTSTITAATRLQHFAGPYYRIDDTTKRIIANNWADLTDGTTVAIATDERGITRGYVDVWTGTTGTAASATPNCADWTSSSSGVTGVVGHSSSATMLWSSNTTIPCSRNDVHLYCVEQGVDS